VRWSALSQPELFVCDAAADRHNNWSELITPWTAASYRLFISNMSQSAKPSPDVQTHDLDGYEVESDDGSMRSLPLSDKFSLERTNEQKEYALPAKASALDKLQAIVEAANLQAPRLQEDVDEDNGNDVKPSAMYTATAHTLDQKDEYNHPMSTTPATSNVPAQNPISPTTTFAYYRNGPLSAGALSSIPSADSNAPFVDPSPSPPTHLEHERVLGLSRETDGSTSALRDVRSSKPTYSDNVSISSETQRKLRPESVLMPLTRDPLILGIALVDFDHAVRANDSLRGSCTSDGKW